jgi:hypothetical protein
MDKLFEQAPKIIEEAAKSPLGLFALMILALSILALLFFREVSPRIRVGIFLVVFLGFLLLGVALYRVILVGSDRSETARPLPSGKVVKVEHLPEFPGETTQSGEAAVAAWLKRLFEVRIIIDKGSLHGTKQGDYFVVIQEESEIKNNDGNVLGVLQEKGSMLQVVDAQPKFSICKLIGFAYESYSKDLYRRLAKAVDRDGNIDAEKAAKLSAPFTVGQTVIAVPREEKTRWDEITEAYNRTLAPDIGDEEKKLRYTDMIKKADEFMSEYGNGYFAPDAIFQKGFAQFQLQQYGESINTFELFLKRYPFHLSAKGANEWIEKARNAMTSKQDETK